MTACVTACVDFLQGGVCCAYCMSSCNEMQRQKRTGTTRWGVSARMGGRSGARHGAGNERGKKQWEGARARRGCGWGTRQARYNRGKSGTCTLRAGWEQGAVATEEGEGMKGEGNRGCIGHEGGARPACTPYEPAGGCRAVAGWQARKNGLGHWDGLIILCHHGRARSRAWPRRGREPRRRHAPSAAL